MAQIRAKRRAQAEFVAGAVQDLQQANPGESIVLVGDLNAFAVNDGYVDVIGTILGSPTPAEQVVLASPDLVEPNLQNLVTTVRADQQVLIRLRRERTGARSRDRQQRRGSRVRSPRVRPRECRFPGEPAQRSEPPGRALPTMTW